jgi:hypothetical protein
MGKRESVHVSNGVTNGSVGTGGAALLHACLPCLLLRLALRCVSLAERTCGAEPTQVCPASCHPIHCTHPPDLVPTSPRHSTCSCRTGAAEQSPAQRILPSLLSHAHRAQLSWPPFLPHSSWSCVTQPTCATARDVRVGGTTLARTQQHPTHKPRRELGHDSSWESSRW